MKDRDCKNVLNINVIAIIVIAIVMFAGVLSIDNVNAASLKPKCTYNKDFKVVWKWNKQPKKKIKGKKVSAKYQIQIANVVGGKRKTIKTITKGKRLSHSYKVTPTKKSTIRVRTYYKSKGKTKNGKWTKWAKVVTHSKIRPAITECYIGKEAIDVKCKAKVPTVKKFKYKYRVNYHVDVYLNGKNIWNTNKTAANDILQDINIKNAFTKGYGTYVVKCYINKVYTNSKSNPSKYAYNSGWYKNSSAETKTFKVEKYDPTIPAGYNGIANLSGSTANKNNNVLGYSHDDDNFPASGGNGDYNIFDFDFQTDVEKLDGNGSYFFRAFDITPERDKEYWNKVIDLAGCNNNTSYNVQNIEYPGFMQGHRLRVKTDPYVSDIALIAWKKGKPDPIFVQKHGWNYGSGNYRFNMSSPMSPNSIKNGKKINIFKEAYKGLKQKIYNDAINNSDLQIISGDDFPKAVEMDRVMVHLQKILLEPNENKKIWFPGYTNGIFYGGKVYEQGCFFYLLGVDGTKCGTWTNFFIAVIAPDFGYGANQMYRNSTSTHIWPGVIYNNEKYQYDIYETYNKTLSDKGYYGIGNKKSITYWMENNPYHPIKYVTKNWREYANNNTYVPK